MRQAGDVSPSISRRRLLRGDCSTGRAVFSGSSGGNHGATVPFEWNYSNGIAPGIRKMTMQLPGGREFTRQSVNLMDSTFRLELLERYSPESHPLPIGLVPSAFYCAHKPRAAC